MKIIYCSTISALILICCGYCRPVQNMPASAPLPVPQAKYWTLPKAERVEYLKSLHHDAAEAVLQGHPLDGPVHANLRSKLALQYVVACDGCAKAPPKYSEVLMITEKELADERISLEISSSPKECQVQYRRVLDHGWLDIGTTLVKKSMPPNFYEFSCSCVTKTQTLDCTYGCSTKFVCEQAGHKPK